MKQAMIFAAGLGTRLRPLTDHMPKALVQVGGVPLLQLVIERLKKAGFERIIVNVHHFSQQIIDFLHAHDNFGIDILISEERETLLNTGGGIKYAQKLFTQERILIHNVDILSNVDFPLPEVPTMATNSPCSTARVTPSRAFVIFGSVP